MSNERVNQTPAELARLFGGREPSAAALARCATLKDWDLVVVSDRNGSRHIVISGGLRSDRFKVYEDDAGVVAVLVLWMDRKWEFALTAEGMWNLGSRETAVGMDFTALDEEKVDD